MNEIPKRVFNHFGYNWYMRTTNPLWASIDQRVVRRTKILTHTTTSRGFAQYVFLSFKLFLKKSVGIDFACQDFGDCVHEIRAKASACVIWSENGKVHTQGLF